MYLLGNIFPKEHSYSEHIYRELCPLGHWGRQAKVDRSGQGGRKFPKLCDMSTGHFVKFCQIMLRLCLFLTQK